MPTLLLSLALAADLPCEPVLHGGVSRPEGPKVSRVDWIAASTDGRRAGLLASRGSIRYPLVYEVGARDTREPPMLPEPPSDPAAHAAQLRAPEWSSAQGLDPTAIPEPVPWCQLEGQLVVEGHLLRWELWDEPCKAEGANQRQWRVCPTGRKDPLKECALAPELPDRLCWAEEPRMVDVYRAADTLWFVVERPKEDRTPRMAAGLALP